MHPLRSSSKQCLFLCLHRRSRVLFFTSLSQMGLFFFHQPLTEKCLGGRGGIRVHLGRRRDRRLDRRGGGGVREGRGQASDRGVLVDVLHRHRGQVPPLP